MRGVGFDGVRLQWAYDVRPSVLPPRRRESRYIAWQLAAGRIEITNRAVELRGTPVVRLIDSPYTTQTWKAARMCSQRIRSVHEYTLRRPVVICSGTRSKQTVPSSYAKSSRRRDPRFVGPPRFRHSWGRPSAATGFCSARSTTPTKN